MTFQPNTKWSDYPGSTLYLWNGKVLYVATEDFGCNLLEEDIAEGYKDCWITDIYTTDSIEYDWVPQGGQWLESELISNLNYTIEGIVERLLDCDLWKDDWWALDPRVGSVLQAAFEASEQYNAVV